MIYPSPQSTQSSNITTPPGTIISQSIVLLLRLTVDGGPGKEKKTSPNQPVIPVTDRLIQDRLDTQCGVYLYFLDEA